MQQTEFAYMQQNFLLRNLFFHALWSFLMQSVKHTVSTTMLSLYLLSKQQWQKSSS
jgi:hypothetical protein